MALSVENNDKVEHGTMTTIIEETNLELNDSTEHMSVRLFCKNEQILHVKSSTLEFIYENIVVYIEEKNLELNSNLTIIMEKLYVASYGVGFDIWDYIKTKMMH